MLWQTTVGLKSKPSSSSSSGAMTTSEPNLNVASTTRKFASELYMQKMAEASHTKKAEQCREKGKKLKAEYSKVKDKHKKKVTLEQGGSFRRYGCSTI